MASQRAFLIDGTALCYRAFYAIRSLSTSEGRPTNAVFGFTVMLQSICEREQPDYVMVAFDVGRPTFRHEKFREYKIQRKPMPDPLIQQIPTVKRLLQAYRIPVFERQGYEAEDILATIASRIAPHGIDVYLVTGDKDALQLVDSRIKVYNPQLEQLVIDADAVKARYGVEPSQMVDLMALMGDEIDNIPGVPGIGPKTATQLIQRFGTLEALHQHLNQIENTARRTTLERSWTQIELSRELARIDRDVPITVSLEKLKVQEPDWREVRSLFRELEFKKLLQSIEGHIPETMAVALTASSVLKNGQLQRLTQELSARQGAAAVICFPISEGEDRVPQPQRALVAIAGTPEQSLVTVIDRQATETSEQQELHRWFADPAIRKVSHDAKGLKRTLERIGWQVAGIAGDTMIAAHLLNPARTRQTLADLTDECFDERLPVVGFSKSGEPVSGDVIDACGRQAAAIVRLHEQLLRKLDEQQLRQLYEELEIPLVSVLAQMEATGIALDLAHLAGLRVSMQATLLRLTQEIYDLAGCSFNLNSPRQLSQVLFDRLKLPVVKRTKTGPSTDGDVLHQLARRHPLPERLLQYRELSKLVSTYVEALPQLVDPKTGRVHTTLNQTATATGRLSSSDPNLQNIPIKTELGRSIRKAFIPGVPDGIFIAADYSQIELRVLADLSGDPGLIEAFRHRRDIHRVTASLIYGLPEAEVQPEQRYAMKAVNYGILYGMSAHGLAKELGIAFEDAQAFIDAYFQRYPRVRQYLQEQIARARKDGFVQTLLGRRRYIPEVNSADPVIRQFGERMAVNAPIQGTAADLIKRAMVTLAERLERGSFVGRMVLQVHDELVLEAPQGEREPLVSLVREVMESAFVLSVPLSVTVKTGPNWLELKEIA